MSPQPSQPPLVALYESWVADRLEGDFYLFLLPHNDLTLELRSPPPTRRLLRCGRTFFLGDGLRKVPVKKCERRPFVPLSSFFIGLEWEKGDVHEGNRFRWVSGQPPLVEGPRSPPFSSRLWPKSPPPRTCNPRVNKFMDSDSGLLPPFWFVRGDYIKDSLDGLNCKHLKR